MLKEYNELDSKGPPFVAQCRTLVCSLCPPVSQVVCLHAADTVVTLMDRSVALWGSQSVEGMQRQPAGVYTHMHTHTHARLAADGDVRLETNKQK